MYYLYILQSEKKLKYYVGISEQPERRLEFHNSIEKGFTSRFRPWKLVFVKKYSSKKEAGIVERKIKNWKSRTMIERIIAGETII
jgi:putative endonuclease